MRNLLFKGMIKIRRITEKEMGNLLFEILNYKYTCSEIIQNFEQYDHPELTIREVEKDTAVLDSGEMSGKVLVIISGSCNVISYSVDGKVSILDHLEPFHVLGLLEVLNRKSYIGASVVTDCESIFIEMTADFFVESMLSNKNASLSIMQYLSKLAVRTMDKIEHYSFNNKQHALAVHLYELARDNQLPYTVTIKREVLAEILHINLRGLYRYINQLKELGFLSVNKGKIVISLDQFKRLEKFCREQIGFNS